jgi:hypothetical protein
VDSVQNQADFLQILRFDNIAGPTLICQRVVTTPSTFLPSDSSLLRFMVRKLLCVHTLPGLSAGNLHIRDKQVTKRAILLAILSASIWL